MIDYVVGVKDLKCIGPNMNYELRSTILQNKTIF